MRFFQEIEFHGSLDRVRTLLLDPDFREEVARATGAREATATVRPDSAATLVTVESAQPTTGMPSVMLRLLGDTLAVRQEERWSTPTAGELTVTIPGQPGRVAGRLALAERGASTVQTVEAEISVRIPLVGGKVEALVASVLGNALSLQERLGNQRLAD